MATYSSIPAWKIPWTEEPRGLQSMADMTEYTCHATNLFIIFAAHQIFAVSCRIFPCGSFSSCGVHKYIPIESVMLSILSSITPFSFCPQSFPASEGAFPMSQLFVSGGQSIAVSASVLPMNNQG